jgi:hypothetical protein
MNERAVKASMAALVLLLAVEVTLEARGMSLRSALNSLYLVHVPM